MTETTNVKRDTRFKPGNPGRPKGARHRTTLAMEALLDGEGEALARRAIEMALAGDIVALRLCLERVLPVRKDRPIEVDLPPLTSAGDAVKVAGAIFEAVAAGTVTPSEASALSGMVDSFVRATELHDLEQRLAALEART